MWRRHFTGLTNRGPLGINTAVVLGFAGLYTLFFAPVLFSGRLLLLLDALLYTVPALYARRSLWTPLLFSGYPLAADPQVMFGYPLAWVFSWGPSSWNLFVITGYLLASVLTYGYMRRLTGSVAAALISGLLYGMSGFLMLHLVHPQMVHSLAWLPLSVWAVEELRSRVTSRWVAWLGLSIGLSALAGHPQVFLYAFSLIVCYALARARQTETGLRTYMAATSGGILLGLGAASILLLPMVELANYSIRSQISFQYFVSLSIRLDQLPVLVFPLLFGNGATLGTTLEIQGYVGLAAIALAFLGVVLPHPCRVRWFWLGTAVIALVLSLGASTPLGRWTFYIPALNAFRGTARHFGEFSFAAAVLAGLGVASVERLYTGQRVRLVNRASLALIGVVAIAFAAVVAFSRAVHVGGQTDPVWSAIRTSPWLNSAIGLQLMFLAAGLLGLQVWSRRPDFIGRSVLTAVLLLDLGHFAYVVTQGGSLGTFASRRDIEQPAVLDRYKSELSSTGHRLVSLRGILEPAEAAVPNLSMLWDIPSAGGYNPLVLRRYSDLLDMTGGGRVDRSALAPSNRSLDILAVQYLLEPSRLLSGTFQSEAYGMKWSNQDLRISMGSGCNQASPAIIDLPLPGVQATHIGLITNLACSTSIPQGSEVVRIVAIGPTGETEALSLKAGLHTSEWAWDRKDVQAVVAHGHAPIYRSFPSADENGSGFQGHTYAAVLPFTARRPISKLRLEWVAPAGMLSVIGISLKDEPTGQLYAVNGPPGGLLESDRWRPIEDFVQTRVLENTHVLPRAWLVSNVQTLRAPEVLRAIRESKLPGGSIFDPSQMALVEEPVDFELGNSVMDAGIRSLDISDRHLAIQVKASEPVFLVLSDVYYPGWQASVDGRPTRIFQTDYVLRGVAVPAGEHRITMDFKPVTFYAGALLTSLAALTILAFLVSKPRQTGAQELTLRSILSKDRPLTCR